MEPVVETLVAAAWVMHDFVDGRRSARDALAELAHLALVDVGADMAGLTWRDPRGHHATVAATDELVMRIDDVQYRERSGPCVAAIERQEVAYLPDTDQPAEWEEFSAAARAAGIRAVLSVPVALDGRGAALNVYGTRPHQFQVDRPKVVAALAAQSAALVAVDEERNAAGHLARVIESRAVIEQAKGVIIASSGCTADEAFAILREQSQTQNRKLRDIAVEVVDHQRRRPPDSR